MGVRALYSNTKHEEGLHALKETPNNRNVITTLMKHILTVDNFNFNNKHYFQVNGCAMSTAVALSSFNIFLGNYIYIYIYPKINNDCLFYVRHIDYIFLYYTGEAAKLDDFFRHIN